MNWKELQNVVSELSATKMLIATKDKWTEGEFVNEKCQYCLMGALANVQSVTDYSHAIVSDAELALLDSTAFLYGKKLRETVPDHIVIGDYNMMVCLNDYLGFEAVHAVLDRAISRVTDMINSYEHSADPY